VYSFTHYSGHDPFLVIISFDAVDDDYSVTSAENFVFGVRGGFVWYYFTAFEFFCSFYCAVDLFGLMCSLLDSRFGYCVESLDSPNLQSKKIFSNSSMSWLLLTLVTSICSLLMSCRRLLVRFQMVSIKQNFFFFYSYALCFNVKLISFSYAIYL
jgi:hypothetical protein